VRSYFVYILASDHRTLYVGVTSDPGKRLFEHRHGITKGFTKKYNIHRLVYFEETDDPMTAIVREKQIKGWSRRKKVALIEKRNPEWRDLSEGWDEQARDPSSLRSSG
jgi:putative endonuclease